MESRTRTLKYMTRGINPQRKVKNLAKISIPTQPSDDRLQEERAWNTSLRAVVLPAGQRPATPRGQGSPGSADGYAPSPRLGCTFTGCQKFLVLLGSGGRSHTMVPPCPLDSTRHNGSNCRSLGSSAGCTGSGLLRCCCGHTDSPHAGGRGCHCGVFPGGSDDDPYCSGPLL